MCVCVCVCVCVIVCVAVSSQGADGRNGDPGDVGSEGPVVRHTVSAFTHFILPSLSLSLLKGPPGNRGAPGVAGQKGSDGVPGPDGESGDIGVVGPAVREIVVQIFR